MNCPSRNDDVLMNPGWNQNPPRFAADLTTCEDLNGIANARELGDADRLCSGSRSLRHLELEDNNIKEMEKTPLVGGQGVKGFSKGDSNFYYHEYRLLTLAQNLAPAPPCP
jgi:zinc transporter 1/2/3